MELKIYDKISPDGLKIKIGDFCNVLPSFMDDYDPESNPEFSREQFIDLINKQIDMRVIKKARPIKRTSPIQWWSYFRIEWYDDGLMYDLYVPDKYLKIVRYIFEGDRVVINDRKIEEVINSYNLTGADQDSEEEKKAKDVYINWAKNKTVFKVLSTYYAEELYQKFSNNWCVLHNDDIENHDLIEYVALPDWCLIKPMYGNNKKPQIKKFLNY